MALKMRGTGSGAVECPDQGTYIARVVSILDLDLQPGYEYQGEEIEAQYKVSITYELPSSRTKDDKPHWVSEEFKVSNHERSNMYKRVNAIDPTGAITNKGENLANLINAVCMVSVEPNKNGYAKITAVTSAPNGMPVAELENTPQVFDWDAPDMEVYNRLPEFMQNKLKGGLNFEGSALHRELAMSGGTNNGSKDEVF